MDKPDLSQLSIERNLPSPAHGRARRWIVAFAALLVLAALVGWYLSHRSPTVETAVVNLAYPAQQITLLNATGYVAPQRKASISSKATGRLEWLGVLEGSRVKRGEVIARLENRDVSAALGEAQANVQVARANLLQAQAEVVDANNALRRSADLVAQRYVSQSVYDSALARRDKAGANVAAMQAGVAAAQAAARSAEVALDQTLIRAPFDGVILTRNANVGDNITPFSSAADTKGAVVTMADMDTLEVEADVSESNLAKIAVGQPALIQLDAFPNLHLAGKVARMVPTVDRSKATLMVKIRFVEHDPRVLPDMSARVAFLSRPLTDAEQQPLPAIPAAALTRRGARDVVFVVGDGSVREVTVAPGRKLGDLVAVSGLVAGQRVVLRPDQRLTTGTAVRTQAKQ